jgi:hypothetical protein
MLTRVSRIASVLTKEAASVPGLPNLAGENGAVLPVSPHGTEGRLTNLAAPRAKLKQMQGPRAYAPRLAKPSP